MHSPNAILLESNSPPPALPPKQRTRASSVKASPPPTPTGHPMNDIKPPQSPIKALPDLLEHTTNSNSLKLEDKNEDENGRCDSVELMEQSDVQDWLVSKKQEEDGPEIRGGPIDALIIQATKATKNGGKLIINTKFFFLLLFFYKAVALWLLENILVKYIIKLI